MTREASLGKAYYQLSERINKLEESLSEANENFSTSVQATVEKNYNTVQQDVTLDGLYTALVVDTFDISFTFLFRVPEPDEVVDGVLKEVSEALDCVELCVPFVLGVVLNFACSRIA